ncbi:MAG: YqjD family protein [Aquabacterium sp.]
MSELTQAQRDKLMADLRVVLADAEALLHATTSDASEGVAQLRSRVAESLSQAKTGLLATQAEALNQAKVAAKATDDFVHAHPWKAMGIAAGLGVLIGVLIGRR